VLLPREVIKLNIDVALGRTCEGGLGAVLRDHDVIILGMDHFCMEIGWEVDAMEAGARRSGLKVAAEMGYPRLIVEYDSLKIIRALQQQHVAQISTGARVRDRLQLVSLFQLAVFNWVSRSCNKDAHHMAKLTIESRT